VICCAERDRERERFATSNDDLRPREQNAAPAAAVSELTPSTLAVPRRRWDFMEEGPHDLEPIRTQALGCDFGFRGRQRISERD
jgi:hypothetical protein